MSIGVIGLESDRLAVRRLGFHQLVLIAQGVAQVVGSDSERWLELEGFTERGLCFRKPPLIIQADAEVVVAGAVIGLEFDRLVAGIHRLRYLPLKVQGESEVAVRSGTFWSKGYCRAPETDCLRHRRRLVQE